MAVCFNVLPKPLFSGTLCLNTFTLHGRELVMLSMSNQENLRHKTIGGKTNSGEGGKTTTGDGGGGGGSCL